MAYKREYTVVLLIKAGTTTVSLNAFQKMPSVVNLDSIIIVPEGSTITGKTQVTEAQLSSMTITCQDEIEDHIHVSNFPLVPFYSFLKNGSLFPFNKKKISSQKSTIDFHGISATDIYIQLTLVTS